MQVEFVDRILARVVNVRHGDWDCWMWQGGKTKAGYGMIWLGGKKEYVHRAIYQLLVGPIPDGLQLDHLCRNRACCNPKHLEPVTNRENCLRGMAPLVNGQNSRSKTHCPAGHPYDAANTLIFRNQRLCRACRSVRRAAYYQAKEKGRG